MKFKNPLLTSVIILALVTVVYTQVFNPRYETFLAKKEHVNISQERLSQGGELIHRRDELQGVFRSIPVGQVRIVDELITEYTIANIVLFFLELNQLIQRSPIPADVGYTIGTETEDGQTVIVPITFNFSELNYQSFLSFLNNIENWNKAVRITSIEVRQPTNNPGQSNDVNAIVNLEVVFFQIELSQESI